MKLSDVTSYLFLYHKKNASETPVVNFICIWQTQSASLDFNFIFSTSENSQGMIWVHIKN